MADDKVPGLSSEPMTLDPRAEKVLRKYLRGWAVVFGVANVAALAAFGIYAWQSARTAVTSVQDEAVKAAVQHAKNQVSNNQAIQKTITTALDDGLKSTAEIARLEERGTAFSDRLSKLNQSVAELEIELRKTIAEGAELQKRRAELANQKKEVTGLKNEIEAMLKDLGSDENKKKLEAVKTMFESTDGATDFANVLSEFKTIVRQHKAVTHSVGDLRKGIPVIISGHVQNDKHIAGDGYSVNHESEGTWKITFDRAFTTEPTVVACLAERRSTGRGQREFGPDDTIQVFSCKTHFYVHLTDLEAQPDGNLHARDRDGAFAFIAVAPSQSLK